MKSFGHTQIDLNRFDYPFSGWFSMFSLMAGLDAASFDLSLRRNLLLVLLDVCEEDAQTVFFR